MIDFAFEEQKRKYIQKFQRYYPEVHADTLRAQRRAKKAAAQKQIRRRNVGILGRNQELIAYRKSLGPEGYEIIAAATNYAAPTIKAYEYGYLKTPDCVMEYIRANTAPQPNNL